jgi:hypothetical protein
MGIKAHEHGRDDIAVAAADYLVGVLDNAAAYFAGLPTGLLDDANVMIGTASEIYPSGAYPLNSADANEGGYLKAAQVYALAGLTDNAKETLQKAEAYTDALTTVPYIQGQYYSLLGYYYLKLANAQAESEAAYIKAHSKLAGITFNENKLKLTLLLAYNAFYRATLPAADRNALIDTYLTQASILADAVYTSGVDDAAAENEADYFIKIAERYASVNNSDKVKASLERAESAAGFIAETSAQLAQKRSIYIAYAKFYSIDAAVEKANSIPNLPDRNSTLGDIATAVANTNDFPNSGRIAFSDTDKDGKPDFFVPWATAEQIAVSGLVLDDDIDGDGKSDDADLTPFFAD